ncbi:TPA: sensor histidine kinase, partial [Clostridioides difficile]|nr:sensor histidine kinase [Clostridioides difficile]
MKNGNDKNRIGKIKSKFKLKFSKKNISIKTRILLSILCLIIIVFMIILVSFNVFLDTYIKTTANEELTKSTETVEHMDSNFRPIKPPQYDGKLPPKVLSNFMRNVQDKVRMAETQSDADAMVVDS